MTRVITTPDANLEGALELFEAYRELCKGYEADKTILLMDKGVQLPAVFYNFDSVKAHRRLINIKKMREMEIDIAEIPVFFMFEKYSDSDEHFLCFYENREQRDQYALSYAETRLVPELTHPDIRRVVEWARSNYLDNLGYGYGWDDEDFHLSRLAELLLRGIPMEICKVAA